MSLQEPVLFGSSIMENIRFGKPGATEAEVINAAKQANAHRFITGFPDGYNTVVGMSFPLGIYKILKFVCRLKTKLQISKSR